MSRSNEPDLARELGPPMHDLFLADAPPSAPADLRARVLRATLAMPQQPAHSWSRMGRRVGRPRLRLVAAALGAVVVLVVAASGWLLLGGLVMHGTSDVATSPSPPGVAIPAWQTNPSYPRLTPGQLYYFDQPVHVLFTVPTGWDFWFHDTTDQYGAGTFSAIVNERYTASLAFVTLSNIWHDPCHWQQGMLEPPLGPTADDLVTALTQLQGFVVAGPVADSVGGLPAQSIAFTPTNPESACDGGNDPMLGDPPGGTYAGGFMIMRVLVAHGTRLAVVSWTPLPDPVNASADLASILDSLQFP